MNNRKHPDNWMKAHPDEYTEALYWAKNSSLKELEDASNMYSKKARVYRNAVKIAKGWKQQRR